MKDEAIKKLRDQAAGGRFGSRAAIMKDAVRDTLIGFCEQDEEFAQAVAQGGSFGDCMAAVEEAAAGRSGISDLDAYTAAVRFYFPGAGIDVQMTIDLCASVRDGSGTAPAGKKDGIVLSLTDFL